LEVRVPSRYDEAWFRDLLLTLKRQHEEIARALNGRIGFGDGTDSENIEGTWVSVTTPGTPNTDFTVTHGLGRLPAGYLVMVKAAAVDVYDGTVAATVSQITLKATVGTIAIKLFIV
jgi:hypothetical protein